MEYVFLKTLKFLSFHKESDQLPLGSVFLLVLGAYTLHTCLRERPRNASATARVPTRARLSLVAPTRTPTQENCAPLFSSSGFAMPSQSLSDTDVDDVEEADDVEDDCAAKA